MNTNQQQSNIQAFGPGLVNYSLPTTRVLHVLYVILLQKGWVAFLACHHNPAESSEWTPSLLCWEQSYASHPSLLKTEGIETMQTTLNCNRQLYSLKCNINTGANWQTKTNFYEEKKKKKYTENWRHRLSHQNCVFENKLTQLSNHQFNHLFLCCNFSCVNCQYKMFFAAWRT